MGLRVSFRSTLFLDYTRALQIVSTFREAARLAKQARASQLVLTHFSPSLVEPETFVENAREVFAETLVGRDHLALSLRFGVD